MSPLTDQRAGPEDDLMPGFGYRWFVWRVESPMGQLVGRFVVSASTTTPVSVHEQKSWVVERYPEYRLGRSRDAVQFRVPWQCRCSTDHFESCLSLRSPAGCTQARRPGSTLRLTDRSCPRCETFEGAFAQKKCLLPGLTTTP